MDSRPRDTPVDLRPHGTPLSDLVVVLAMLVALTGVVLALATGGR